MCVNRLIIYIITYAYVGNIITGIEFFLQNGEFNFQITSKTRFT